MIINPNARLAAEVVRRAIFDMRGRSATSADQIAATAWLVSKAATFWFDAAGWDQEYVLARTDQSGRSWVDYADALLVHQPSELTTEQKRLLVDGMRYMSRVAA